MTSAQRLPSPEEIREHKLYREMGLTDWEYERVVADLGRLPNYTEASIYGVMWSEHCSYKHSKPLLRRLPTEGPQVLMGPGEGAGVVDIGDGLAVVFKVESHNHPSAVEPYHGAATGAGGVIRDIYSMGARPIALLNSLRFGQLDQPRARYLFKHAVAGIADYGNAIGIPTLGGESCFSPTYEGNPLVNAMCVGLLEHGDIHRGVATGAGNWVVYVGAATGRDGVRGAAFASEELGDETEARPPVVPTGDPEAGRRAMEACLEIMRRKLAVGIQDMGAAGLTSSSTEMAAKGGHGIELNLDLVPQSEPDMQAYEIMLSETQERMLLVVTPENLSQVQEICSRWGVPCVAIGRVQEGQQLRLMHRGELVAELPLDSLVSNAPVYETEAIPHPATAAYERWSHEQTVSEMVKRLKGQVQWNFQETLRQILAHPNAASKEWVFRQYQYPEDSQVAVAPGADAGVVRIPGTQKGVAVTIDGHANYVYLSPRRGGRIAVAEAARNLACTGARPLALTDGLNYGNPEKGEIYWQLKESIEGMREACLALQTPVISGNVSLYNETRGEAIYPTPMVGMVGLLEDMQHLTGIGFQEEGDLIYLLGDTRPEIGGSLYQEWRLGDIFGPAPDVDLQQEAALQSLLLEAIRRGLVRSAHDLSVGGLAVALCESAFVHELGVSATLPELQADGLSELELGSAALQLLAELSGFSESQSRVLLSLAPEHAAQLEQMAKEAGVPCRQLGVVQGKGAEARIQLRLKDQEVCNINLRELKKGWQEAIPCRMQGDQQAQD